MKPRRRIANTHADTYLHAAVTETQTRTESLFHALLQEQRFLQTVSPAVPLYCRFLFLNPPAQLKVPGTLGKMTRSLLFIALCTFSLLAWMVWSVCLPQHAVSYHTHTHAPLPLVSLLHLSHM